VLEWEIEKENKSNKLKVILMDPMMENLRVYSMDRKMDRSKDFPMENKLDSLMVDKLGLEKGQ